jgi:maleate isomerase
LKVPNIRKRIGLIYPSAGISENEFIRLAPRGITVHVTRIKFERATVRENLRMLSEVKHAAKMLSAAKVDVICFDCTTGSLIGGKNYNKEIEEIIKHTTGIKAVTAASAAIRAMNALGMHKIALITPYPTTLADIERKFLEANGILTLWLYNYCIDDPTTQGLVSPSRWVRIAEKAPSSVDGVFISCGGIRVIDVIELIERKLGVPCVTTNQAALWASLREIDVTDKIEGFGKLLTRC